MRIRIVAGATLVTAALLACSDLQIEPLPTVGSGVSDPEILAVCREEGVNFAQGFLIGKPVPYDEFVAAFLPTTTGAATHE